MSVRERPILFSGPMVRAILEGRKTHTRRVVSGTFSPVGNRVVGNGYTQGTLTNGGALLNGDGLEPLVIPCPYGQPGDRLWVRETWRPTHCCTCGGAEGCDCGDYVVTYHANDAQRLASESSIPDEWTFPKAARTGNVPGIHMPRWASRLTLEVVEVRVQRLKEISEEDAREEGVEPWVIGTGWKRYGLSVAEELTQGPPMPTARASFETLWSAINGERPGCSWDNNPWVWAITFKRITQDRKEQET